MVVRQTSMPRTRAEATAISATSTPTGTMPNCSAAVARNAPVSQPISSKRWPRSAVTSTAAARRAKIRRQRLRCSGLLARRIVFRFRVRAVVVEGALPLLGRPWEIGPRAAGRAGFQMGSRQTDLHGGRQRSLADSTPAVTGIAGLRI